MLSCSPICFATDLQRSTVKPAGTPASSVNENGAASSRKAMRSAWSCRTLSRAPASADPKARAAAAAKDKSLTHPVELMRLAPLEFSQIYGSSSAAASRPVYIRAKDEEPKRVSRRRLSCDNLLKSVLSALSE